MHPWVRLLTGLIAGCWIGAAVGCAITLLVVGKRVRQLESANLLLRVKLRSREKPKRTGTTGTTGGGGPVLVIPPRDTHRPASSPITRIASGDR